MTNNVLLDGAANGKKSLHARSHDHPLSRLPTVLLYIAGVFGGRGLSTTEEQALVGRPGLFTLTTFISE